MIQFLWEKTPKYIKYPIMALVFLIWTPYQAIDKGRTFLRQEITAVASDLNKERDYDLKTLKEDIQEVKQDTRDIKNILMRK